MAEPKPITPELSPLPHSLAAGVAGVAAAVPPPPVETFQEVTVDHWHDGQVQRARDQVAEEVPVALTYHGVPHVVMLATPANLEDLAVGFTLSEEIVARREEIVSVEALRRDDGALEVRMGIAAERFSGLLRRQRNMTGRTGCGLCGTQTVEDAIRNPRAGESGLSVSAAALHAALADLQRWQQINRLTGSVHAAAWVLADRGIQLVREDVGRHNALDKVIGAVARSGVDFSTGYFLVTSRASYEMVQKTATAGAPLLAAVSAPTAFAIRLAAAAGVTLVGFLRESRHVVYANPGRLTA